MKAAAPRVVIAGGSVAGLAAGCALTANGWQVTVVESRAEWHGGGRAILVQPNGLAALERIGALAGVRERGRQLAGIVFIAAGAARARYDYGELRHPHPYLVEIRPEALRAALAERFADLGGEPPRMGWEVTSVGGEDLLSVDCRTDAGDDATLEAEVVVGADGPGSVVRAQLGIGSRRFGDSDAYVLGTAALRTEGPDVQLHCGPGYGNGVVPLPDGTYLWDRVTEENRQAVAERDVAAWRRVYATRLPPGSSLPDAIESWDQLTVVRVRPFWARRQAAGRAVLVGDAAGAVHPHSAQGANLALEDAAALGDALGDASRAQQLEGRLERHRTRRERRRRRFVLYSLLAARSMDAANPAWRGMRAAGFVGSRLAPYRKLVVRAGAGV